MTGRKSRDWAAERYGYPPGLTPAQQKPYIHRYFKRKEEMCALLVRVLEDKVWGYLEEVIGQTSNPQDVMFFMQVNCGQRLQREIKDPNEEPRARDADLSDHDRSILRRLWEEEARIAQIDVTLEAVVERGHYAPDPSTRTPRVVTHGAALYRPKVVVKWPQQTIWPRNVL